MNISLNIDADKTKLMKINVRLNTPITVHNKTIREVTECSNSTIEDLEVDTNNRVAKASGAFATLKNVWKPTKISTNTKIRIFETNIIAESQGR